MKFHNDPWAAPRLLAAAIIALVIYPFLLIMYLAERAGLALQLRLTARDVHIDGPLSDFAVEAFDTGNIVANRIFPTVPVGKQSDGYWKVDPDTWLRLPTSDERAPKTAPDRVEFSVSTDTYFCKNRALAGEISDEERANADNQIMLERRTVDFVTSQLIRMKENRVASKVGSISNLGSGVALTGTAKWSNYASSSPLSDVTTGHAFVRQKTGIRPNVAIIDWDTTQILRRHPELLDYYKYTAGGQITMEQLRDAFSVGEILVPDSVKNTAKEGQTASMSNIWGNVCLLMHLGPASGLKVMTYGVGMRWTDPALGRPFAVRRYRKADEGTKTDVLDVGYYDDEKIVAQDLSYGLTGTI